MARLFIVPLLCLLVLSDTFAREQYRPSPSQYFLLKNKAIGKCLDVQGYPGYRDRANIQVYHCEHHNSDTDQVWKRDSHGRLVNRHSGKCLDVKGYRSRSNRANLQLFTCEDPQNRGTDHIWNFYWNSDHTAIQIQNRYTRKCVDVVGYARRSAKNVQQFSCEQEFNADTDQWWELLPV